MSRAGHAATTSVFKISTYASLEFLTQPGKFYGTERSILGTLYSFESRVPRLLFASTGYLFVAQVQE